MPDIAAMNRPGCTIFLARYIHPVWQPIGQSIVPATYSRLDSPTDDFPRSLINGESSDERLGHRQSLWKSA